MIDRILNFSYESFTPNGIYEKVSATPKFLVDPLENVDTFEVLSLKRIIKEKGLPTPAIYRGTYLSYSNNLKSYPRFPWVYYYRPEKHAFPLLINIHQARNLFKNEQFEREWLLEHPNETEKLLTITLTEDDDEDILYVYRTCISHQKMFSYPSVCKTYNYYIVRESIDKDGNHYYSHPLFIKPTEFEEMKANTTRFNEIVDRFF